MNEVTIKDYVDRQIASLERGLDVRFTSLHSAVKQASKNSDKAVEKAEQAVDRRLESMNEFRATLTDQAASFLTRSESNVWRNGIERDLKTMSSRLDKSEGRGGGMRDFWGWIVAAIAVAGMLFSLLDRWSG